MRANRTLPIRLYRRLRYGSSIIVVSGLPRSGTSLMMQMLRAGGVPVVSDGSRGADESNPRGYLEFEPVKQLGRAADLSWLTHARGKAVKIVSALLKYLPGEHNYQVIFMHRDLGEVIASQDAMLVRRGEGVPEADPAAVLRACQDHLAQVRRLLDTEACFDRIDVEYRSAVERPGETAAAVAAFLGRRLDVSRMAAVSEPSLYRTRT